jgi:hypothetical protein
MQNTSHAVMAQRSEARDSLDDFPTPPWATRALIEHVIGDRSNLKKLTCLEPACGAGHMAKVLGEHFRQVCSSDIHNYGYGEIRDYLAFPYETGSWDWVITNPPFRLAKEFVRRSLCVASKGVAVLVRSVFTESVGRYENLFRHTPPTKFAQFAERVPMVKGRLDRKASTATGYAWMVWDKQASCVPQLTWVPRCRKTLERQGDYDAPRLPSTHARSGRVKNSDTRQGDLFRDEDARHSSPRGKRAAVGCC